MKQQKRDEELEKVRMEKEMAQIEEERKRKLEEIKKK